MTTSLSRLSRLPAAAAMLALSLSGCTLDKQSAPALSGPSGVGLSLSLAASPDALPRDGSSVSTISIVTKDVNNKPVQQRVLLQASSGTLSADDVTTNASGVATVQFVAPSMNQAVTSSTITAFPVDSTNAAVPNSISRTITIGLAGPAVPVASFTFTPSAPGQFDNVTFDASGTMLGGSSCGSACTYSWNFGDGNSASGQIVSHRYSSQGTVLVTLTVSAPGGASATKEATVVVGAAQALTPTITYSPTDPHAGQTVIFDASSSKAPDGAAITSYAWDFGNGSTASTVSASTTFATANTYTVRLTITDSVGRTGTTTTTVAVK